ncbi:TlpA disulfide reductase family protein [Burkholderia oklahomensis]|uniref:TlpA disulfide reductase family protein n=1 Tax=Burkholderia oklahomensis TaxID=342113 RepID=UPI00265014F0|nr:TlpA disulfide reductase family protein [Burkholderia oklahomensis]MDN7672249.1 TlpA disulfide reductase family protein [Burkholderia oklahomensis]
MKRIAFTFAALVVAASSAAAELQPLRAADIASLYASGRGAPLVVEIWSLDCGYCRENAAHLVEWQRRHPQVRVALVALDSLDEHARQLADALAQMKLPGSVAQYANDEPMPERLRAALDPGWRGELPRTVWIGADGARRAKSGLLAPGVLDTWLQRRDN